MRRTPFPYETLGGTPDDAADALATLEALVRDLRRYAEGRLPSPDELASAPLVSDWRPVTDPSSVRLVGIVSGHPKVGPGPGMTSGVFAVASDRRWIRTWSRLWRLGPALPTTGRRHDA